MIQKHDFIIVGQGLAGATLALTFLQQGKTVLVVDEEKPVTASKVAAGIWNPMVFKRYTASWMAQTLLDFNTRFYPQAEQLLKTKFYHPKTYYKVFSSADDVTHWKGKLYNTEVAPFLIPEINTGFETQGLKAPLGAAPVAHCGYLDVAGYVAAAADYLKQKNCFLNEKLEYASLFATPEGVEYKGQRAAKIIFCEGQYARQNPYWQHLPFHPSKGEVFTIRAEGLQTDAIVSKGIFVLPLGNATYRVGSTYYWDDQQEQPTERGREELLQKLQELIMVPFEIIEHKAAVRPTVAGRRPLIGLHPKHPAIGIFNGLGTRGVLLAPYFANHLAEHVLQDKPLLDTVNVQRFGKNI